MLNFYQSLPFLNCFIPVHPVLQDFPANISHKIFPQDFPQTFPTNISHKISHKHFPQTFPTRFSCKILLQTYPARFSPKNFQQEFPELDPDWLAPHHPIPNAKFPPITVFLKLPFSPPPCPARFSCKISPARISHKIFPQEFPARISRAGS